MWTAASTPSPTKRAAGSRAASSAGCSDKAHGDPDLPAAGPVRPVGATGSDGGTAVRPAALFPAAAAPLHRPVGHPVLPGRGHRAVFLHPPPGGGPAAGICGAGSPGRRGAVFLPAVFPAAARVGLLGGHPGIFPAPVRPSSPVVEKILQKSGPPRKKSLLFFREMLYNNKKWTQSIS